MATETVTASAVTKVKASKKEKLLPESERFMRACSDIASALI